MYNIKQTIFQNSDLEFFQKIKIRTLLPSGNKLIMPFSEDLKFLMHSNYEHYVLADHNADLINLYKIIAAYQEDFIEQARCYFIASKNNLATYNYYRHVFNLSKKHNNNHGARLKMACIFLYLVCHSFHQIIRYNERGDFDVPYCCEDHVDFPEAAIAGFIDKINATDLVAFRVADYRDTLARVTLGEVLYCCLPAVPLTANKAFPKYHGKKFSWYDKMELLTMCKQLKNKYGIATVITEHGSIENIVCDDYSISEMLCSFLKKTVYTNNIKQGRVLCY